MQRHVHQRKGKLARGGLALAVGRGGADAADEVVGDGFARFHMLREGAQQERLQAPVFHELAGELDGIPLDVVDTGRLREIDAGEHALEGVPEFVEEGVDLAERHERGAPVGRRRLIAAQKCERQNDGAVFADFARPEVVHPGAAVFGFGARIGVEVEIRLRFSGGIEYAEEAHIGMPDGGQPVCGHNCDAEEVAREGEEPLQHGGELEVGAQRLGGKAEKRFNLAARPVGDIPRLERLGATVFGGEGLERIELFARLGQRGPADLVDQRKDLRRGVGHAGVEAQFRVVREPEQGRHFAAQFEDFAQVRRVVQLARRGARGTGAVEFLTQVAAFAEFEKRLINGDFERHRPRALFGRGLLVPLGARGMGAQPQHVGREPGDLLRRRQEQTERLAGVERVV